ncbi:MAG: transposase, partial [Wolbachia sp.]
HYHKSISYLIRIIMRRAIPKNIDIIYLPPYSPDINPVERFWLYIKQNILRNKIYDTIALLESALCKFITSLSHSTIKKLCNAAYLIR